MSLVRYSAKDYKNIRAYCKEKKINFINANILYDSYESDNAINLCFEGDVLVLYILKIIPQNTRNYFHYIHKKIGKIEVPHESIEYNIVNEMNKYF